MHLSVGRNAAEIESKVEKTILLIDWMSGVTLLLTNFTAVQCKFSTYMIITKQTTSNPPGQFIKKIWKKAPSGAGITKTARLFVNVDT